jgi:hypothetical protein
MTHLFISAYCCDESSNICIHLYQCTKLHISYLHGAGPTCYPTPSHCLSCTFPLPLPLLCSSGSALAPYQSSMVSYPPPALITRMIKAVRTNNNEWSKWLGWKNEVLVILNYQSAHIMRRESPVVVWISDEN